MKVRSLQSEIQICIPCCISVSCIIVSQLAFKLLLFYSLCNVQFPAKAFLYAYTSQNPTTVLNRHNGFFGRLSMAQKGASCLQWMFKTMNLYLFIHILGYLVNSLIETLQVSVSCCFKSLMSQMGVLYTHFCIKSIMYHQLDIDQGCLVAIGIIK